MVNGAKVIALTGQSGCGKSTVARRVREWGWPVLDADRVAASVLAENAACVAELVAAFGADILDENGALRRRLLADRAFTQPGGQRRLTDITHPYIIRALLDGIEREAAAGATCVFVDGAVIVGEPFEACCDAVLVVDAPRRQQIERLCVRDGITEQQARHRLNAQVSKKRLAAAACAVIRNDADPETLLRRTDAVLQRWKAAE